MAELCESDENIEGDIENFEGAAELFQSEELHLPTSADKRWLSSWLHDARIAIDINEEIAPHSPNNNSLKYGVKERLLNGGLSQLCKGDHVTIGNALERYRDLDSTFSGTRECTLLQDVAAAIDEEDVSKFTNVVKEFDSVAPLDSWNAKELEEENLT